MHSVQWGEHPVLGVGGVCAAVFLSVTVQRAEKGLTTAALPLDLSHILSHSEKGNWLTQRLLTVLMSQREQNHFDFVLFGLQAVCWVEVILNCFWVQQLLSVIFRCFMFNRIPKLSVNLFMPSLILHLFFSLCASVMGKDCQGKSLLNPHLINNTEDLSILAFPLVSMSVFFFTMQIRVATFLF